MVNIDPKYNYIIDSTIRLFTEKQISSVTIKDIAEASNVGEATIYRHFQKKQNIVLISCMRLQQEVFNDYFVPAKGKTGYEGIKCFYISYLEIFKNHPEFYRFIKDFDSYLYENSGLDLSDYEQSLDEFKNIFMNAYSDGLKEKSVKQIEDIDTFYYATTHSLLELCKKLSLDKPLVIQDKQISPSAEIERMIDIFMMYLSNN